MPKTISFPPDFLFVGYPDTDLIKEALAGPYSCFGEEYSSSAEECLKCRAPVRVNGKIVPLRTLCASVCKGKSVVYIRRLPAKDVQMMLLQGNDPAEIVQEMVQEDTSEDAVREARNVLYRRFRYLEKEKDYPTPELPSVKDLVNKLKDA